MVATNPIFKLNLVNYQSFGEFTYTDKCGTPSLNASGSIVSIGLSDNILEKQQQNK